MYLFDTSPIYLTTQIRVETAARPGGARPSGGERLPSLGSAPPLSADTPSPGSAAAAAVGWRLLGTRPAPLGHGRSLATTTPQPRPPMAARPPFARLLWVRVFHVEHCCCRNRCICNNFIYNYCLCNYLVCQYFKNVTSAKPGAVVK